MTKSISLPANARLPSLDRRSLVCRLGTAAVAGVPVLGSTAPMCDDPVFQALAELERLKIHAEESEAAHSVANALRYDGADIDMLTNIVDALPAVIGYEMEAARRMGRTNMRNFLSRRTSAAFDVAKEPKVMERIQRGNTALDAA